MKQFVSFVIKEAKHILRDKRTMLILFGMPVVMMLLFGFAITTDVKNVRTVVVTSQIDHLTQQAVERLSQSEYFTITATVGTPREAEQLIRSQQADMAVVFASNFASKKNGLQLIIDGSDPNMAQQWATYAQGILLNEELRVKSENSSHYTLHSTLLYNPQMKSAYNFVPAIMGMLLMLICAMMTSISIVREKERGTMEVLLVSPVRPLMVIIAKAVPYLVLAFIILVVILLMARYVLGVPLVGSLFWIIAVSIIYILLALSLGLLISNIAQTQLVALLLSAMVLLMPVVMLSGMMFPIESMPQVLQWIAAIVPPRYYIEAMRKLMIMGVGIGEVTKEVTVLAGMTVLLLTIALKKFNVRLE
ncbi:MAG: ABC transporter permease [Prevotella sp.]|nr:ABC transporter permease [Prevotella sp.]